MTNSGTIHSQAPLYGIKLAYTPVLLLLVATFVAPALAGFIVAHFMRTPDLAGGSNAYRFNDAIIRNGTILVVGAASFAVSYFMTSFERPSANLFLTHLRQASLLWVYLVLKVLSSVAQARSDWIVECYVCSLPWSWIALPAIAGNLLALALRARRTQVAA